MHGDLFSRPVFCSSICLRETEETGLWKEAADESGEQHSPERMIKLIAQCILHTLQDG